MIDATTTLTLTASIEVIKQTVLDTGFTPVKIKVLDNEKE